MVKRVGPGRYHVNVSVRVNGRPTHITETVTGTKLDAMAKAMELHDRARCSLTIRTFGDMLRLYTSRIGYSGAKSAFNCTEQHLGKYCVDSRFVGKYEAWIDMLESTKSPVTGRLRSQGTINKYKAVVRMVLGYARKKGLLWRVPITDWDTKPASSRDRILSQDEEARLLRTLQEEHSYLYPAVRFAMRNPIRAGDLFSLTRDNLDQVNECVFFRASKTKESCHLIIIDNWLWEYLTQQQGLLFAKPDGSRIGNYATHWHTMLKAAKIVDFRFHDLRRCAGTYMLQNGFSERDLVDLGLWKTVQMISRYYHGSAYRVMEKYGRRVAGNVATRRAVSE